MSNDRLTELLQCYGGDAPRYTSYPSAAHFQAGFSSSVYERLLTSQPEGTAASLYVHIPFCRSLCHYCGCFTRVVHDNDPVRDYLELVGKEIALAGEVTGGRFPASHIHFGGGSPNLLEGDDIGRLLHLIELNFSLRDGAEIALECDPRQMNIKKAGGYAMAGVSRVSLGVQDFNEKTQHAINRVQPFSQVADCVAWLRQAGIKKINFDLIYGLPYQTPETVADNAFKAASLGVDRIALFGYAHVPWMRTHQKNLEKHGLPAAPDRYEQAEAARAVFLEEGYVAIGMDHFALPGDPLAVALKNGSLRRNFQGYTTDQADSVLGFGLSAISRLPEAYAQNTTSLKNYREALEGKRLPVEKGRALVKEDRLRADIIGRLMCYFTADVGEICKMHGFPPGFVDDSLQKIRDMEKDGIVETGGRIITVTERGRYFVRSVCTCFDAYYKHSEGKYARAV